MTTAQWGILAILGATVAMFMWGRWRHDMVAAAAGLREFAGVGNPLAMEADPSLPLVEDNPAVG